MYWNVYHTAPNGRATSAKACPILILIWSAAVTNGPVQPSAPIGGTEKSQEKWTPVAQTRMLCSYRWFKIVMTRNLKYSAWRGAGFESAILRGTPDLVMHAHSRSDGHNKNLHLFPATESVICLSQPTTKDEAKDPSPVSDRPASTEGRGTRVWTYLLWSEHVWSNWAK